jgi:hypothetical protein
VSENCGSWFRACLGYNMVPSFALRLMLMSVGQDDTTQGIVTSRSSGTRSVGLCNVCNSVGPLLTACSADECVLCMYTPGEQQVRRNGRDAKKHGKARRKKKGKIVRLGPRSSFSRAFLWPGIAIARLEEGGRIRDWWMKRLFRAAYDDAQR